MISELVGQERIIDNKDWATALFVLSFVIIAVTKSAFLVSNKYNKIYKESSQLFSWFNVALMSVLFVSMSFFIQLILDYMGLASRYNWILFIQLLTMCSIFILSKFLIEKIIAVAFDFEEVIDQYNLQKVNYRTYISLCLLPINMLLFYTDNLSVSVIYTLIGKLFYFILYLCTLEIAPYYFVYYWFTKK
jgi:hypothetical protein